MKHSVNAICAALMSLATLQTFANPTGASGLGGPAVKGVCILNRTEVFANAQVAKNVTEQYRSDFEVAQAEVSKEREVLETEAKSLQVNHSALKSEELQRRQAELSQRLTALQSKAKGKTQELETRRRAAVARIASEAQPVIEQVYKEKGCGLLISREAVLAGNMDMDITASVILQLDKKITALPFAAAAPTSPGTN